MKGAVTYMVMDDLEVKALCTSSVVTLVSKFNVDVDIEEKVVDFGMDEVYMFSVHYSHQMRASFFLCSCFSFLVNIEI